MVSDVSIFIVDLFHLFVFFSSMLLDNDIQRWTSWDVLVLPDFHLVFVFVFFISPIQLKKKWSNPTIQQRGKGRGRVGAVNAIDDPLVVGFFVLLPAKINGPERGR